MTDIDLTLAIEAALTESYQPPQDPGHSFMNRESYDALWRPHVEAMIAAALPHIRVQLAADIEESANQIMDSQLKALGFLMPLVSGVVSGHYHAAKIVRREADDLFLSQISHPNM